MIKSIAKIFRQENAVYWILPVFIAFYAFFATNLQLVAFPFVLILAAVVIYIFLKNPLVGLYILVLNIPLNFFIPMFSLGGEKFSVSVNEFLVALLLLSILLKRIINHDFSLPSTPYNKPIFFLIFINFASLILSLTDLTTGQFLKCSLYYLLWVEYFFLFLFIYDLVKTKAQVRIIVKLLLWSGMITVISAIYQQIRGDELLSVGATMDGGKTYYRLVSMFGFRSNHYAAYLLTILSIMLNKFFMSTGKKRLGWLVLILPTFYVLFFTFSRGGFLGFLALAVLLWRYHKKERRRMMVLGLVFIIIAGVAFAPIFNRWQKKSLFQKGGQVVLEHNIKARLAQWEAGWHEFFKRPLIGGGFQSFSFRFVGYESRFGYVPYIDLPDSMYMKQLIEAGILGVFSFFWFILVFLRLCRKFIRIKSSFELYQLAIIGVCVMICFLIGGLTDSNFQVVKIIGPVFVIMAIIPLYAELEKMES